MFSQIILVIQYLICTMKLQTSDCQYSLFLKKSNKTSIKGTHYSNSPSENLGNFVYKHIERKKSRNFEIVQLPY